LSHECIEKGCKETSEKFGMLKTHEFNACKLEIDLKRKISYLVTT